MRNGLPPHPVLVGIHVVERPHLIERTLESLRLHARDADIVLLPDAALPWPDMAPRSAAGLWHLAGKAPGAAAAFNRLIAFGRHPLVVFLENGAAVGPNWLVYLSEGLEADPRHGIAGPSANWSWNEQGAIPADDWCQPMAISQAAYRASRQFGRSWRGMTPEEGVADFCYAVRREVIDTVGMADEGYGEGPCWEIDYTLRARRAGFAAIWCGGAFVHRPPESNTRREREARLFEANKRRYQAKLRESTAHASRAEPATAPLVTCVVLTHGRPRFLDQSVRYFERQDYPNRELLIIDSGPDDAGTRFAIPGVRYHHLPTRPSLGIKRNLGCELARGEIICHWDDDDWYGPTRISRQAAPLLAGQAEITGLKAELFFDLPRWRFWTCTPELRRRMFVGDVSGGTLVYWRWVWDRLAHYPDASLAEDAAFLDEVMRKGARLERLSLGGEPDYIYLRHPGNTWQFDCGTFVDPAGWHAIPEPPAVATDRDFYAALSEAAP